MSNNMPLEARVAERIRNSELGQFFNEDDLNDIVQRAIKAAFFTDRPDPATANSYHYSDRKTLPPLVVEIATETFKEKFAELVGPVIDELFSVPEFRDACSATIFATIARHGDAVVEAKTQRSVYDLFSNQNSAFMSMIVSNVRNAQ